MAMSLPMEDRDGDEEVGLDIDDFLDAEEIDLDHEIPEDKEDPIEEAHEDGNMYEGDMDLTEEQIALLEGGDRAAIMEMRQVMLRNHWPRVGDHMIIPYTINANQFDKSERKNIARAFEEYEKQTCIRIIPRTTEADYIGIERGSGCSSAVGVRGGRQRLKLGTNCANSVGTPIHEFMHAIGYLHEQSRADRDKWVDIDWDNIKQGKEHNFRVCEECSLQDLPYDIGSVMHYNAWSFAKDRSKPTIIPKNGITPYALGQRNGFSESDVVGLNKLFCKDTCYVDKKTTEECRGWKKHCGGKRWGDWMNENCARTCEFCRKEIVKVCEDSKGTSQCNQWRQHCGSQKYGSFMASSCAKTCKVCN